MSFTIRRYCRFPVQRSITYMRGPPQAKTRCGITCAAVGVYQETCHCFGQMCLLTVSLPNHQSVFVATVIVT